MERHALRNALSQAGRSALRRQHPTCSGSVKHLTRPIRAGTDAGDEAMTARCRWALCLLRCSTPVRGDQPVNCQNDRSASTTKIGEPTKPDVDRDTYMLGIDRRQGSARGTHQMAFNLADAPYSRSARIGLVCQAPLGPASRQRRRDYSFDLAKRGGGGRRIESRRVDAPHVRVAANGTPYVRAQRADRPWHRRPLTLH